MTSNPPCPAPAELKRLLDGELPDLDQTGVSRHLDTCPACQQQLEELAADDNAWDALAGHLKDGSSGRCKALQEAMDQLRDIEHSLATHSESEEVDDDPSTFLDPPVKPRQLGKLDQYEIIEIIGRGGMGIVFKALDPGLHRIVAIKVMTPQLAAMPSARLRFVREARATAAVCHEHVVTIHAVSEAKGLPYLVMQLVGGVSLQDRLEKKGPLRLEEILRIGMQTAQGLAAAHAQGLVHRDIKPANILLENGVERVKITDFGLARAATDARITQSGVIVGTPQYMAPEQISGENVDHRADLFSLGSVLYFMCTGRPPFQGVTTMAVIRRVCEDKAPPIQEINPNIPDYLAEIIARLQAKDPANRLQTAAEVADLLNYHLLQWQRTNPVLNASSALQKGVPQQAAPALALPSGMQLESKKVRSGRRLALLATVCLLTPLALTVYLFRFAFPGRASSPEQQERRHVAQAEADGKHANLPHEIRQEQPDNEDTEALSASRIPAIPEPPMNGQPVDVRLAEPFAQVRTGGGGRYLVFHLKKARKLALFDVCALKVVNEIQLESENVVYSCGRDKLLVVLPGKSIIQRYDLRTCRCEHTEPVPDDRPVLRAAMGCNSQGPLLLWTGGNVVFFDVEHMEQLAVEGALLKGDTKYGLELRASADGQTFVGWTPGIHPAQYTMMRLVRRKAIITLTLQDQGYNEHWAMPGADASLIFRYDGGLYSADMKILAPDGFQKAVLLPTEDPRFFLALRQRQSNTDQVDICSTADRQILLSVPDVDKMTRERLRTRWGLVGGEPRIRYLHSAHVMLTLPESNDRVVVRPLDLFASLAQQGKNYLFVLSPPRRRVRAGTLYEDVLDIQSRAGGVTCHLKSGPQGMSISSKGELQWQVPSVLQGKSEPIIVNISDASGMNTLHRFDLAVE